MNKEKVIQVPEAEYEYLKWFRINADFGPAHSDVVLYMQRAYESTGKKVPAGWRDEE